MCSSDLMEQLELQTEDVTQYGVIVRHGQISDGKVLGDKTFTSANVFLLVQPAPEIDHLYIGPRVVPPGALFTPEFKGDEVLPYHLADVYFLPESKD